MVYEECMTFWCLSRDDVSKKLRSQSLHFILSSNTRKTDPIPFIMSESSVTANWPSVNPSIGIYPRDLRTLFFSKGFESILLYSTSGGSSPAWVKTVMGSSSSIHNISQPKKFVGSYVLSFSVPKSCFRILILYLEF